jgi:hypothetical protein
MLWEAFKLKYLPWYVHVYYVEGLYVIHKGNVNKKGKCIPVTGRGGP